MNVLPYFGKKLEERQSYTDAFINAILRSNSNVARTAVSSMTSAAITASGIIQRALQSAEIEAPEPVRNALTADTLGRIGYYMALEGQAVFYRVVINGIVYLTQASTTDVTGGYNPMEWRYGLQLPGPSNTTTKRNVPAQNILHFRWSIDRQQPWIGLGPLQSANLDSDLLATLSKHLLDETGTPRGYFIPLPKTGGADANVEQLKADIQNAKGSALLVESMADAWQAGSRGQQSRDWGSVRFGANVPEGLNTLYDTVHKMVLQSFGISPQLFEQGAQTREAWRTVLFGVVRPLANVIQQELSLKFDTEVFLRFADLRSSDLQARARAYKALIDGGMDASMANRVCGFNE